MLFGGGAWGVVGCLVLRIARRTGPDGIYRAEEAGGERAVRRSPKERLLDRYKVLRRRAIADLPRGTSPARSAQPCTRRRMAHCPPWILLPKPRARLATRRSSRAVDTNPFAGESQVVTTDTSSGASSHIGDSPQPGQAATRELRQLVKELRTSLHGVNEQLAATIKNQYDHLENTSGLVDTHHEPSPRIVFIVEGT